MKGIKLITVLLLVFVVGCSSNNNANPNPNNNNNQDSNEEYVIKTLEKYPIELLPLYEVIRVNSNDYHVREDKGFIIGKDLYAINFESSADIDEIAEYYRELVDEIDPDMDYDTYNFSGIIDNRRINFFIQEGYADNAVGNDVTMSIGADPSEYADTNMYFNTYPQLIEVFGYDNSIEYTYTENYTFDYVRYVTSYFTKLSKDEVFDHYRELYKDKENFTEQQSTETTYTMYWYDQGYLVQVYFNDYSENKGMSISVEKRN